MSPFAIAGLQLDLPAATNNFELIRHRIHSTLQLFPWVQMVVVSELATFGSSTARAEPLPGPTEAAYAQLAAEHRIWLVPGSLYELAHGQVFNTAPVIAPDGTVVARCRKQFPFLPYEQGVASGTESCVFHVPDVGTFGVSICYDMWFPETTRALATLGAEVVLHPTMTPTHDRELELTLARANAISNQCYFFDINGAGALGNGRSIVIGPEGEVLHQAGAGHEVIAVEVDLMRVRRCRERGTLGLGQPLKSFRDRRSDFSLYAQRSPYLDTLGPLERPNRAKES